MQAPVHRSQALAEHWLCASHLLHVWAIGSQTGAASSHRHDTQSPLAGSHSGSDGESWAQSMPPHATQLPSRQ